MDIGTLSIDVGKNLFHAVGLSEAVTADEKLTRRAKMLSRLPKVLYSVFKRIEPILS